MRISLYRQWILFRGRYFANMKLTKKQIDELWGETGPYSQVDLINPLTYELIKKHRAQFTDDLKILQLLDHADYRGYEPNSYELEHYQNDLVNRE